MWARGPARPAWAARDALAIAWHMTLIEPNAIFRDPGGASCCPRPKSSRATSARTNRTPIWWSPVMCWRNCRRRSGETAAGNLWAVTARMLVLVEPGTPQGFARIRAARAALIEAGGHVAAPCTHDNACPMSGDDWCHFSQRLPRSRDHMIAKGARVPFEDERYAYVVVSRAAVDRIGPGAHHQAVLESKARHYACRCAMHPVCAMHFIARRDKDAFRAVRRKGLGRSVLVFGCRSAIAGRARCRPYCP